MTAAARNPIPAQRPCRLPLAALAAALVLTALAPAALACRCAPRTLAEYFQEAEPFRDTPVAQVETALARLAGTASSAKKSGVPQPDSIVGLVTIPRLMAQQEAPQGPVAAFATPRGHCGRTMLLSADELVTREVDYEVAAAVVHEVRDGRYRLGLSDTDRGATVWLPRESVGRYYPLADLLQARMTYLTSDWDGFVWPHPEAGQPQRPGVPAETVVKVLGSLRSGTATWLQLEIYSGDPCQGEDPVVVDTGWVPAWSDEGRVTVWFWSRGC